MTEGLPAELYLSAQAFARERRTVFAREWLLLARCAALARAGDYVCANLGGWPVFAIRNRSGTIAAYRNVCRHQGMAVLDNGAGTASVLRCRYHGWTYDLDGRFVEAPPRMAPADPGDPSHNLPAVATVTWQGLLLVHLGDPQPLDLGDAPLLDGLSFQGAHETDIAANWKIVVEHLIAGGCFWRWPTLAIDAFPGSAILHQVIPRGFDRTRLVRHDFSCGGGPTAADESMKAICEERQAMLKEGLSDGVQPVGGGLVDFRRRVRAAHEASDE